MIRSPCSTATSGRSPFRLLGGLTGGGTTNYPVELRPLVSLGSSQVILGLAGAELAEVLGSSGNDILEELESDSA